MPYREKRYLVLSHTTLRDLHAHDSQPRVSFFLPTSPSSASTQEGSTHLKNLLREAKDLLEAAGLTASDAEALLDAVEKKVSDREFWQHQQHGLALFVSPTGVVEVSVAHTLEPAVVVGEYFDVLPVMPGLATDGDYTLLCASQDEVSVYRGNAAGLEAVAVPGIPTSLDDVLTDADYENPVLASPPARPNTGTHNMTNSQVYGDAPPEWQAMVRRKFAERLTAGLNGFSGLQGVPTVVIADDVLAGEIAVALGAVGVDTTHPTSLNEKQRHEVSWGLVHDTLDRTRQDRLSTMARRLGQNDAVVTDPAEVVEMAGAGRVDELFVSRVTPDASVSEALWLVLGNGGEVFYAEGTDAMPDSGVVALLRY
jgi:hypothetical protein